jgi:hypothetical protein
VLLKYLRGTHACTAHVRRGAARALAFPLQAGRAVDACLDETHARVRAVMR